jgi:hypothetical protein
MINRIKRLKSSNSDFNKYIWSFLPFLWFHNFVPVRVLIHFLKSEWSERIFLYKLALFQYWRTFNWTQGIIRFACFGLFGRCRRWHFFHGDCCLIAHVLWERWIFCLNLISEIKIRFFLFYIKSKIILKIVTH